MDQVPNWLTAAVDAAGMTAFAEDLEAILKKPKTPFASSVEIVKDEPVPPLH